MMGVEEVRKAEAGMAAPYAPGIVACRGPGAGFLA